MIAPKKGEFLYTCREGFEAVLADELGSKLAPRVVMPSLVSAAEVHRELTFARQAMRVSHLVEPSCAAIASAIQEERLASGAKYFALHVWVPDSDAGNRQAKLANELRDAALLALGTDADRIREPGQLFDQSWPVVQVCVLDEKTACVGALPYERTISTWPGGRARMKVPKEAPSRAAMKLAEALHWVGFGPDRGETCVDLGAAPGGWTWLLLKRGARVLAIDPAKMAPELQRDRKMRHIKGSAFDYEPDEPVDWLFCDMVWRPLEVAALIAKWGRRRSARFVLSNIKLPMKDKTTFVARVRETVEKGGWRDVRTRHLYHDREEITLFARR